MNLLFKYIGARSLVAALAGFGFVGAAQAAVVGTDSASASGYSTGWVDGTNGSTSANSAFGAWGLSTVTPTGSFAGFFVGNSTDLSAGGAGANINDTGGHSFGLYANSGASSADATRSFASALNVGQTFSVDLAVNFRNGNRGIDLKDASNTTIFNFNTGGDDYVVSNAATGNGSIGNGYSTNTAFNLLFTQTSATGGTWTITRSGGVPDSDSGTYTGVADGLHLYIGGADTGSESNLYANNLAIAPEPASLSLLGLGALALLRRRK